MNSIDTQIIKQSLPVRCDRYWVVMPRANPLLLAGLEQVSLADHLGDRSYQRNSRVV